MDFTRYRKAFELNVDFFIAGHSWLGMGNRWLGSIGMWLVVVTWSFAAVADIERPAVLNTVQISDRFVQYTEEQHPAPDQAISLSESEKKKKRVELIERIALQKAIVRVAGVESVLKNELVRSVLEAPQKVIRSFQARPSLGLTDVVVDESLVKKVLEQSGEAWWKIQRPKIWVRVVHVKDYQRSWRGLDDPWAKQVVQELHGRGFTAVGPETHRMGGEREASEFLGGFWNTYIEEAAAYDGYVFVIVAEQQGFATIKVTFNLRGEETELTQNVSAQPGGYQALLNTAFERVVQKLLAATDLVVDDERQFTVKVVDADDLATVFEVEDLLIKLTGPSSVHLKIISLDQVVFSIKPTLGWLRWLESLHKTPDLGIVSETHNEVVVRWLN